MSRITNGPAGAHPGAMDKNKDWQLELLMEKLRSKSSQFKSFPETSKTVRMTLLDKRYSLDSVEKSQHQKCLDTLQHSIKVTSLQSMVERLESLTRQLGLKFVQAPSGVELFISSDMFFLEIILDQTGAVREVKVHHEGKVEQQSCEELVNCLSKGDFADFTTQLEGFASIYQLNAEKKVKCKAFTALQSLEADLSTLAQLQTFIKEPFNILYKSPVGILEKRKGGHAMKLTYFVSPYDLINKEKGDLDPISIDAIASKNLGYSVTVYMEGSTAHKLQTSSLITVNRNHNGKGTPIYAALTSQNSAMIPACFVLRLNKPMPMCLELIKQIRQVTELDCIETTTLHPLLSLIATHSSDGKLDSGSNRGMFVTLPDQTHCYFMTENKDMQGVLVNSIPFTHPGHVAQILLILRQQALFNTIIASCIRPNSRQDLESMIMLEVNALSWTHISISLEHPIEESMATAEIDLSDISNLTCRVFSPGSSNQMTSPDLGSDITTKVLNRSFSIPVTMRSVLLYWDKQIVRKNHYNGHENFNLPLGSGDPGGRNGNSGNNMSDFDGKIKQEPSGHGMMPLMNPHQGMFLNETLMSSANYTNFPTGDTSSSGTSAVLTNIELTNILAGNEKPKRVKRKASDDLWKGGGKRKAGDDDGLLDASSCDSTSRSTPLSQETVSEIPTPNSALGFHSDLELSGLDPSELINEKDTDFDADDLGDVEELLGGKDCKSSKSPPGFPSTGSEFSNDGSKTMVPACVSITPITQAQGFGGGNVERRPGIEIIPITTAAAIPSSITITPISGSGKSEERSKEKKSNKSKSDDKGKLEKKKKRKREESPMGPPEKIPSKTDPLSKPVSVSIKPAESPPLPTTPITPNSPNMVRKFNQSPTHNRNVSLSGKLSPSMLKPGLKTHSPKHSPAHVPSSPKHVMPSMSSPKSHSPKHPSTSGSGKPSMTTLKNAANSPSSKSGEGKSKSAKDREKDKDKKSAGNFNLNSSKSKSGVKVKPLDLNSVDIPLSDGLPSPVGMDLSKPSNSNQVRNRKGCLSDIVDKLKNAKHSDLPTDLTSKTKERNSQISKSSSSSSENLANSGKSSSGGSGGSCKTGELKNSEYMVKHSLDGGMKITINKTRSKDSKSSSLKSSGTGLKPGVNSGPASKKPQQLGQKSSSGLTNSTGNYSGFKSSTKTPSVKSLSSSSSSSSSSNLKSSKLSVSPKSSSSSSNATDLSRNRDRPKLNRSSSDKSIFSNREKKGSPTQNREDSSDGYKNMVKIDHFSSGLIDGGMKFDKNFQIPKLSARTAEDKKLPSANKDLNNTKMYDMLNKSDLPMSKYPLALPTSKMFDNNMEAKIRNTLNSVSMPNSLSISSRSSSPKLQKEDSSEAHVQDDKKGKDDLNFKFSYPISASKGFSEPLSLSTRSIDLTSKFVPPAPKDEKKDKKDDCLLDYSKSDNNKSIVPIASFPPSPSVSVHIVKSPAPSPLISRSPHSASPGITDDELMDEALVGPGK